MTTSPPTHGLELRSRITKAGQLQLSLEEVALKPLAGDDLLVRVEGSPLNPSDLGLLLGPADISTMKAGGSAERPTLTADVPQKALRNVAGRLDESMAVGNEGAGTVIAAGPDAQALVGKKVAMIGGAMYAQYRVMPKREVLVLPDDASAADGASCFVNPLTALGMTETMRREGHKALIHTVGASNLGQMLNKICLKDGIPLVNIVRNAEQVAMLKALGATHIVDSSAPTFLDDLVRAIEATEATIAFDAIGGGKLATQILTAMENVFSRIGPYSRYGSTTHKQVYLYGGLDTGPTELYRNFGMAWSMGGWLLFPFLQKIGAADAQRLRERVIAELKTTFASHYTAEISLAEALKPEVVTAYYRRATGQKYLINPSKA